MILNVYSIKDVKAGFMNPFTMQSDELAKRYYKNSVHSPQPSLISMNPEDFELWRLGTLDTDSGVVTPGLEFVCNANAI